MCITGESCLNPPAPRCVCFIYLCFTSRLDFNLALPSTPAQVHACVFCLRQIHNILRSLKCASSVPATSLSCTLRMPLKLFLMASKGCLGIFTGRPLLATFSRGFAHWIPWNLHRIIFQPLSQWFGPDGNGAVHFRQNDKSQHDQLWRWSFVICV